MTSSSRRTASDRIGEVISGRYRIQELIGEGGMGAVYLAEHTLMRKRVALKLLRPEMLDNAEAVARFEREAVAAAQIDHPNVVAATDFGKMDDGAFFLALEYIDGNDLRSLLTSPLAPRRVVHIARQIALALDRAHQAGIVHRDLKPENVMLVERAEDPDFVKVLDFGIAKIKERSRTDAPKEERAGQPILTKLGEVLGTPEYMSPEQSMGDPVGPPSDLYALGIVMYEMLTGVHPFNPPTREMLLTMHVLEPVPPMKERAPSVDVPEALETIVRRLLEKEPGGRYATAAELAQTLESVRLARADASPKPPSIVVRPPDAPPAPERKETQIDQTARPPGIAIGEVATEAFRSGYLVIGGAVLLLVVIVALVVSSSGGEKPRGGLVAETDDAAAPAISSAVVTPPPPKPSRATREQIEGAARNPEALEELARQFPTDTGVLRELVLAYDDNGRTDDALRTMTTFFAQPSAKPDRALLAIAVAQATNGKGKASDDAFALLESSFEAEGVDALIEILRGASPALQKRAQRSVEKDTTRTHASPAARVYLDLRSANSCQAKHEVLSAARDDGDSRVLQALRNLKAKSGCGLLDLEDCWPCLRHDRALDDAIAAVAKRSSQPR